MFLRKSSSATKSVTSISGSVGKLLNEIAAAPQQRRLTAVFGDVTVVVDTSNRELVRVISIDPSGPADDEPLGIVARDEDQLSHQMDMLGTFLARLAELPGAFSLTAAPAPLRYSTKLQGFSREELTIAATPFLKQPEPVVVEPVVAAAQSAPAAAIAAAPVQNLNSDPDLRFYEQISPKSTAAIVLDWNGNFLRQAGNLALLDGLVPDLIADVKFWIEGTKRRLTARQFIVLRADDPTQMGICLMTEPASVTAVIFSSTATGRVFAAAAAYD